MQVNRNKIINWLKSSNKPLVFFDLDSTIYDLSKRQITILKEFAKHFQDHKDYHHLSKQILEHSFGRMPFFPKDALDKYGLTYPSDFEGFFYPFWYKRFFSNEYLKYDTIEPGVKDFVMELIQMGVQVVYLTGRDNPRMGLGTKTKLRSDKLYNDGEELILKPDKSLIDKDFKLEVVESKMAQYDTIVFIDNEAANVNLIYKKHAKNIYCVYYDSVHSKKEEPLSGLYVLNKFT